MSDSLPFSMFCVSLGVFMYIHTYINIFVHIEEKW